VKWVYIWCFLQVCIEMGAGR